MLAKAESSFAGEDVLKETDELLTDKAYKQRGFDFNCK